MLFILLAHRRRAVGLVVGIAALASAAIETLRYVFTLGHSDISDMLFNTLGALVGAIIAYLAGRRLHALWTGVAMTTAIVFAVPVLLGPRLGDPDKVVEVAASGPAGPGSPAQAGVASAARP